MTFSLRQLNLSSALVALIATLVVIIYFGFVRNNHLPANQAQISIPDKGIVFKGNSLALSSPFLLLEEVHKLNTEGFELTLRISPEVDNSNFSVILGFQHENTNNQWLLAQWRNYLILLNNDDYNYHFKKPRLEVPINLNANQSVKVVFDGQEVRLQTEEKIVRSIGETHTLPEPLSAYRMVLGNHLNRRHPWSGIVHEVELRLFKPGSVPHFSLEQSSERYYFSVNSVDQIGAESNIIMSMPKGIHPASRQFFKVDFSFTQYNHMSDSVVNVLGFIPFSFFFLIVFIQLGVSPRIALPLCLLVATLLSFSIEYCQGYMIYRSSSIRDLLLNISGSLLGIFAYNLLTKTSRKQKDCKDFRR